MNIYIYICTEAKPQNMKVERREIKEENNRYPLDCWLWGEKRKPFDVNKKDLLEKRFMN